MTPGNNAAIAAWYACDFPSRKTLNTQSAGETRAGTRLPSSSLPRPCQRPVARPIGRDFSPRSHLPRQGRPQPVPELKAVAVALHMLTRDSWNAEDFKVFDCCWRELTLSDLFDDFESDRFRIQKCVDEARKACLSHIHFDNSAAVFYPESTTMPREARLPRKKPAESTPQPLVNHPLVRHAVKVFNATVVEPDSDEALQSPFVQPEVKTEQVTDKEAGNSGQENTQPMTGNREELLRQFCALDDALTISQGRKTRRADSGKVPFLCRRSRKAAVDQTGAIWWHCDGSWRSCVVRMRASPAVWLDRMRLIGRKI